MNEEELRAHVIGLCQANQKIEAIKLYRQATGKGLADAKNDVEAWARGETLAQPLTPGAPAAYAGGDTVESYLRAGQKISAIKLYREQTGLGLAEAKNAVEAMEDAMKRGVPITQAAPAAPPAGLPAFGSSPAFGASSAHGQTPAFGAGASRPVHKPVPLAPVSRDRKPFGDELPSEVGGGGTSIVLLVAFLVVFLAAGAFWLFAR